MCFTALSFIDVKNLTTDNIVDINGDKWIISKRHKTNIPFQVKLMDVPLQIIDRYKHLQVLGYTLLLYSYVELLCAQFPNLRFLILPFT